MKETLNRTEAPYRYDVQDIAREFQSLPRENDDFSNILYERELDEVFSYVDKHLNVEMLHSKAERANYLEDLLSTMRSYKPYAGVTAELIATAIVCEYERFTLFTDSELRFLLSRAFDMNIELSRDVLQRDSAAREFIPEQTLFFSEAALQPTMHHISQVQILQSQLRERVAPSPNPERR